MRKLKNFLSRITSFCLTKKTINRKAVSSSKGFMLLDAVIAAGVLSITAVSFFALISFNAFLWENKITLHSAATIIANHLEELYGTENWSALTERELSPGINCSYFREITEFGTERLTVNLTVATRGQTFERNFSIERVVLN